MKFTPNYGWPIAEEIDVVKQYPAMVDEPFKMALDASPVGASCYARGNVASAVAGQNSVALTEIMYQKPSAAWTLSGGYLLAPWDGDYQIIASGTTMGMWQTEVNVYSNGGIVAELETQAANAIGSFSAAIASFEYLAAGEPFLQPSVQITAPSGQLIGNLHVVYLGKH